MDTKNREQNLDLLRILSLTAVMVMHSSVSGAAVPGRAGPVLLHAVFAAVTWCVPCFVMCSGRFLLDPERSLSIRKLWTRYIPRVALAFLLWSGVYVLYDRAVMGWEAGPGEMLSRFLEGAYHLWYLYLIAGLYLIAPLLRRIAREEKLSLYFLLLFFVFSLLEQYGRFLPHVGWALSRMLEQAHVHLVLGYSGYFLLGWVLYRAELSRRAEGCLYAAGLLCLLFTCFAPCFLPIPEGENEYFYQLYEKPNVIVESAALYRFFVRRVPARDFSPGASRLIAFLAELNFGMYLGHVLFMEWIAPRCPGMSVFLWIPLQVLFAFAGSAALSWLLHRIPPLRRIC